MNILIFFGSPHKDGLTANMVKVFTERLQKKYSVNIIDAYQSNIAPCMDCGYCKNNDGCSIDDFQNIANLIQEADCIIIATPVYYLSLPAPLKAIFDRFQQFYSARFCKGIKPVMIKPKIGGLLICSGSQKTDGVYIIRKQVKMAFSLLNCKLITEVAIIDTDSGVNIEELSHKINEFTNNMMNDYLI